DLAIVEILKDPDPGQRQSLQQALCLNLLAAKAGQFRHDEDVERRPRFEAGQQLLQPWPGVEFGAADAVILVDVRLRDRPAFAHSVETSVLDLSRNGPLVLGDSGLLGGFARVNSSDHALPPGGAWKSAGPNRPLRALSALKLSTNRSRYSGLITNTVRR